MNTINKRSVFLVITLFVFWALATSVSVPVSSESLVLRGTTQGRDMSSIRSNTNVSPQTLREQLQNLRATMINNLLLKKKEAKNQKTQPVSSLIAACPGDANNSEDGQPSHPSSYSQQYLTSTEPVSAPAAGDIDWTNPPVLQNTTDPNGVQRPVFGNAIPSTGLTKGKYPVIRSIALDKNPGTINLDITAPEGVQSLDFVREDAKIGLIAGVQTTVTVDGQLLPSTSRKPVQININGQVRRVYKLTITNMNCFDSKVVLSIYPTGQINKRTELTITIPEGLPQFNEDPEIIIEDPTTQIDV